jgi:hypothetical protein
MAKKSRKRPSGTTFRLKGVPVDQVLDRNGMPLTEILLALLLERIGGWANFTPEELDARARRGMTLDLFQCDHCNQYHLQLRGEIKDDDGLNEAQLTAADRHMAGPKDPKRVVN